MRMTYTEYLQAQSNATATAESLDSVLGVQQAERAWLKERLDELDRIASPLRNAATSAKNVLAQAHRRLLNPWVKEHKYRWPSATIYTYGNDDKWWARLAWLRMVSREERTPKWQWEADIDLYDPYVRINRVFRCFGPSADNRVAIVADFQKHLAVVTELLEESGYIIVPSPSSTNI